MKKIKEEKGITLVALIITIVVLLILAVVAIGSLQESNIIGHAQNATAGYNQAKNTEEKLLGNYANTIEENMPKGKEKGITVNELLNKAYTNYFNSARTKIVAYSLKESEGKIYLYTEVYDVTTGEKVDEHPAKEVKVTNEFEKINIIVNNSGVEISSEKAILVEGLPWNIYISEFAMYQGIEDGGNYNSPSDEIVERNSSYDSYINN